MNMNLKWIIKFISKSQELKFIKKNDYFIIFLIIMILNILQILLIDIGGHCWFVEKIFQLLYFCALEVVNVSVLPNFIESAKDGAR